MVQQIVKLGASVRVDSDNLTIQRHGPGKLGQRTGQWNEAAVNVSFARDQKAARAVQISDAAKSVLFQLKDKLRVIEGRLKASRIGWRKVLVIQRALILALTRRWVVYQFDLASPPPT